MAGALSKFLTGVGATFSQGFGGGSGPKPSVFGQDFASQGYAGPKGAVTEGQGWTPYAQSNANQIGLWQGRQAMEQAQQGQGQSGASGAPGAIPSLGGDWAGVDQWNSQIDQAIKDVYAKTGVNVPASVVKAIMKIESDGQHLSPNYAGYVGLMQVGPGSWGVGTDWDLNRATTDPAYNIFAGTMELARRYEDAMSINPGYDWSNVATGYFSGHYEPTGASDAWNSDYDYQNMFNTYWQQLNAGGGGMSGGGSYVGGGNVTGLIAGSSLSDWGEFNAPSGNGLYGYGTSYGLDGVSHTGLDIAAPIGAAQYAAGPGTVVCAATGNGSGSDGAGCGAFNYVPNFDGAQQRAGAGRIEILLDNGVSLIYGHSLDTYVQPGQRVNAGDLIGTLGGMNSAHVHLEARVRDSSMESGWRIVDPRSVLGGMPGFTTGGTPQAQPGYFNGGTGWWGSFMSHFS